MDKGARGWIYNTARKNYWRVCDFYELDDLIQDGFLKYAHVKERYHNVKAPAQLMALFKRAYTNHIHDLARKKRVVRACTVIDRAGIEPQLAELAGYTNPDTSPAVALLPPEVRKLMHALLNDPRARSRMRRRLDGTRQTTNEFFCRLVGLNPSAVNLHVVLTEALGPE